MNKFIAAAVASVFALGTASTAVSSFAADAAKKKDELTAEQRAEMRDRAEKMKEQRAKGAVKAEKEKR
jgi:hypothetical protein